MKVDIYCDGSCLGNGNVENFGGFGVVVVVNDNVHSVYKKGCRNTTNNRMELEGVIFAIKLAKTLKQDVAIYCDSAYVINTINSWMNGWALNGWIKKTTKKAPENLDLIKQAYELMTFNQHISILKVKGHADDKYNNLADCLACQASAIERDAFLTKIKDL